jgi:peptide/nickel transport system ATP-binding protein
MRAEFGMALVLISHDMGVVAGLADRILVMYAGRIVERARGRDVAGPRHPYTAELLKCMPSLSGPRLERMPTLPGQPPQPGARMARCAFAPALLRAPRALPCGNAAVAFGSPIDTERPVTFPCHES